MRPPQDKTGPITILRAVEFQDVALEFVEIPRTVSVFLGWLNGTFTVKSMVLGASIG